MKKGKFGISLVAIAVIAFSFGVLKQPQSVLLIAGFALLAERDEWLNKQVMQALLLIVTYYVAVFVSNFILGGFAQSLIFLEFYKAGEAITKVNAFIIGVFGIVLIIISILAILRILKGKDAGLPYISKIIETGIATESLKNYQGNHKNATPVNPEDAPREQQAEPIEIPYDSDPISARVRKVCPSCFAPLEDNASFCTNCGTKVE